MTYTVVIMEVSQQAYDEIRAKLEEAGYQHAIHDEPDKEWSNRLDMHGIALAVKKENCG